MNRKILGICVVFLAVAILTVPTVSACGHRSNHRSSLEKIPVTETSVFLAQTEPTKTWNIGDKYTIDYGVTYQFATTLNLPDATFNGISDNHKILRITNLETDTVTVFVGQVVWDYTVGTFEGKISYELRGASLDVTEWWVTLKYCVLKGTGAFEGQTLTLSYDGLFIGAVWTGYILKS